MKCKIFEMAEQQKVGQEMLLEEGQAVFNFPKWFQSGVWRLRIGIKLDVRWWSAMVKSPWPLLSWQVCTVWNLTLNKWRGSKVQRIHLKCALGKSPPTRPERTAYENTHFYWDEPLVLSILLMGSWFLLLVISAASITSLRVFFE